MKTLKKYWTLYRENLGTVALFQLVGFLVGMLIVLFINASINEDADFAPLGSLLAITLAIIPAACRSGNAQMFLAVSMGQTRRSFLLWDTFYNTVGVLAAVVVSRLLYFLELALYAQLYPGFENGLPLEKLFSLPVLGLLVLAAIGAGLLFMMLKVRFGQKVFVFTWCSLWILFMVGSRAISAAKGAEPGVFTDLGNGLLRLVKAPPENVWFCVGYGLAALLVVSGVLGLRRVELRQ